MQLVADCRRQLIKTVALPLAPLKQQLSDGHGSRFLHRFYPERSHRKEYGFICKRILSPAWCGPSTFVAFGCEGTTMANAGQRRSLKASGDRELGKPYRRSYEGQAFRTSLLLMLTLLTDPFAAVSEVARVDETLVWNQVMLDAIVASTLGNPPTMRMAATVNTAMFDAQNSIGEPRYRPIFVTDRAPRGTHRPAAIVQAAYVTLKSFYPAQLSRFDEQRALSLAEFDGDDWRRSPARHRLGRARRDQILTWRETDGFSDPVPPFTGAGQSPASGSLQPVQTCRTATSLSQRRSY